MKNILIVSAMIALMHCSTKPTEVTGGTETGDTKVSGVIRDSEGAAASGVEVLMVSAEFDAIAGEAETILRDTTDSRGAYAFQVSDSGTYTIMAVELEKRTSLLIPDIDVSGDSLEVDDDTLKAPGAILLYLSELEPYFGAYLYIAGTPAAQELADSDWEAGYVILDSLPAGPLPAVLYLAPDGMATEVVAANTLVIISGDTVFADIYAAWGSSSPVYCNTTAQGADVQGDVTDYPLLIRLTADNFAFSQAQENGEDIRFAKSDGSPLSYEISRWAPSVPAAEIWVRMDTVYGDDDTQHLILYWSKDDALPKSAGEAVFDTAAGFLAVWHLDEAGSVAPGGYADATHYDHHGTGVSMTGNSGVEGIVGGAQDFDGSSDYIYIPGSVDGALDLREDGFYTISAWVYTDVLDWYYHTFIGKGDNQYNFQVSAENQWHFVETQSNGQYEVTEVPAVAQTWTHVTGVRNGAEQLLYVNGIMVDNTITIKSYNATPNTLYEINIGRNDERPEQAFDGKIDEPRISGAARSADWIKLCYENQKPDQTLVEIRR
jgi:hypothetical protein